MSDKEDKKYRTTAEHIRTFMDQESLNGHQMADIMHVSYSGLCTWLNKNDAPSWTVPMLEGLKRRRKDTTVVFVARLEAEHFATVAKLINTLGGKASAL